VSSVRLAVSSTEEWSERKRKSEGEVPFYGRGRVRHLWPRQNFRLVTAGRRFRSVALRFSWRRPVGDGGGRGL